MPKIFLIDDNPHVHEMVQQSLEDLNCEITGVQEGSNALEVFEKVRPDIILLDVTLPDTDGYELCREFRETANGPSLKIALLAGPLQSINQAEAEAAGFDQVLHKPLHNNELLTFVNSMLHSAVDEVIQAEPEPKPATALIQPDTVENPTQLPDTQSESPVSWNLPEARQKAPKGFNLKFPDADLQENPEEQTSTRLNALIENALGTSNLNPSKERIREEVAAVCSASMPELVEHITDRLMSRLKGL